MVQLYDIAAVRHVTGSKIFAFTKTRRLISVSLQSHPQKIPSLCICPLIPHPGLIFRPKLI